MHLTLDNLTTGIVAGFSLSITQRKQNRNKSLLLFLEERQEPDTTKEHFILLCTQ